jgi:hypothetical protein
MIDKIIIIASTIPPVIGWGMVALAAAVLVATVTLSILKMR